MSARELPHVLPGDRVRIRAGEMITKWTKYEDGEQVFMTSKPISVRVVSVKVQRDGVLAGSWCVSWRSGRALLSAAELRQPAERHHLRRGQRNDYRVGWAAPVQASEPPSAPVCVDCAKLPVGVGCWRHIKFYGIRPRAEDVSCLWDGDRCPNAGEWAVWGFDLVRGVLGGYVSRICTGHLDDALDAAAGDKPFRVM